MKKSLTFLAIFSILLAIGCKKNDNNSNGIVTASAVSSNVNKGQ